MFDNPCAVCIAEQEDLFERTGGACGQVICTHPVVFNFEGVDMEPTQNMINTEVEEEVRDETMPPVVKKRKHKSTKKDEEHESEFPTLEEMHQSVVSSFSTLPIDKIYQILSAEKKTDKFNGEACAHITVKAKGEWVTRVVRSTQAIFDKLYKEEKYEDNHAKNNFYIVSKGKKLTSKKWNYLDFIIMKKKKL